MPLKDRFQGLTSLTLWNQNYMQGVPSYGCKWPPLFCMFLVVHNAHHLSAGKYALSQSLNCRSHLWKDPTPSKTYWSDDTTASQASNPMVQGGYHHLSEEWKAILLLSFFTLLHIFPMEFTSGTCCGQSRSLASAAAKEFLQHTIMDGQVVSVNMYYSIKTKHS